jgi:hypothetical protein
LNHDAKHRGNPAGDIPDHLRIAGADESSVRGGGNHSRLLGWRGWNIPADRKVSHMLLAVSDVVWQALIGAIVTIVLAWMQQRTKKAVETTGKKAAEKADEVAGKVAEVAVTLGNNTTTTEAKLSEIAKVGEMTHDLCNSGMLEQKRLVAVSARGKADVTHDRADIKAAEAAEEIYEEHKSKQKVIDSRAGQAARNADEL